MCKQKQCEYKSELWHAEVKISLQNAFLELIFQIILKMINTFADIFILLMILIIFRLYLMQNILFYYWLYILLIQDLQHIIDNLKSHLKFFKIVFKLSFIINIRVFRVRESKGSWARPYQITFNCLFANSIRFFFFETLSCCSKWFWRLKSFFLAEHLRCSRIFTYQIGFWIKRAHTM